MLTREYPPEVYGGAGVHVEYLARELRELVDLTVHAFGAEREGGVRTYRPWGEPLGIASLFVEGAVVAVSGAALRGVLPHSRFRAVEVTG